MAKQLSLFKVEARSGTPRHEVAITAAAAGQELYDLARQLPAGLRLGTSSWHFPGWKDIVWRETAAPGDLSRYGLAAYAQHPLFSTVCIDRSF